jgi:hypothetical protein
LLGAIAYVAYRRAKRRNKVRRESSPETDAAEDVDSVVRRLVAEHPRTPAELMTALANDEEMIVRWGVARNPNTSVEILNNLGSDDDEEVRKDVARNPNTSLETFVLSLKRFGEGKLSSNPVAAERALPVPGKETMKEYKVRITARVDTIEFVEAENEEQACLLAEQKWTETYIVYNPDLREYSDFSEIIGYEPEEIK